jgi:ketosteroid isomerase-like protein
MFARDIATQYLVLASRGARGSQTERDTARAMSQENVEIVRHIYESGLFDRDPEELLRLGTPDMEYVNPSYAVEPGVRRGLAAVGQAMRRFAEGWDQSRHELNQLYDCGDVVVAAVSWHTRSRGSARDLINEEAHSWTLREGRLARFEWGQDLGKALEAAGFPG